jgi:hypothetical protein
MNYRETIAVQSRRHKSVIRSCTKIQFINFHKATENAYTACCTANEKAKTQ